MSEVTVRPRATDTSLPRIPKVLRVDEPYDLPMMIVAIPDRKITYIRDESSGCLQIEATEGIPVINLRTEAFVRMNCLSKELQEQIRTELNPI